MAAARIAAVFLAAVLPAAGAQQSSLTQLTVLVTDITGGIVPGAQVNATSPSSCASKSGTTDDHGTISLQLSAGGYHLYVVAPGFCPERKTVEVFREQADTIPVRLTVGGCPSKCTPLCVTVETVERARPEPGRLSIHVTDRTGAFVPGACIEVDSPLPAPESLLETDGQGQASLELPAGSYKLSIAARAFAEWNKQIDVQGGQGQTIRATLEVAPFGGPVVVANFLPDLPLGSPEQVFLPFQSAENLAPLPSRRAKRRW